MPPVTTTSHSPRPAVSGRAASRARPQAERPGNGFGFFLFLLVNAALFVRPADVVPGLQGIEFYQYLILACLAISFPAVVGRLSPGNLERSPIVTCVVLLMPIIVMSHVAHSKLEDALEEGVRYFKILIYFLLLVSLVTTSDRMRTFIGCLIFFASLTTLVSILDFNKVITLPRPIVEPGTPIGPKQFIDPNRMYGPGIFKDPNDVGVLIVTSLVLMLGKFADPKGGASRWLYLPLVGVFGYGFYLTQSRGALLALMIGVGIVVVLKHGWGRAMMLGGLAVPLLIGVLAGRLGRISTEEETGQERIELWNAGIVMLKENPVFGVGQDRYHIDAGHVAHNSYMQQFGDTGFPGGALFLGAVVIAVFGLYRHARPVLVGRKVMGRVIVDPTYRQLHPYLTGAMCSYAVGMMTLTLNPLVTTYTMLGLASVFLERAETQPPGEPWKFDFGLMLRLAVLSVVYVLGMFIFIRLTFRA